MFTHKLQDYIRENYPRICKMEQQLTYEQAEMLISLFPKPSIMNILEQMENYKPLSKKYVSVYRTMRNWLQTNAENPKKGAEKSFGLLSYDEVLNYLTQKSISYSRMMDYFELTEEKSKTGKPLWKKR